MNVRILNDNNISCDEFVKKMPDAKLCHLLAWSKAISNSTGLKNFYLAALKEDQFQGVLPLIQVQSRIFGNRMISGAMSNYGGILADSQESQKILFNKAVELATELNCESIEFRNISPLPYDLEIRSGKMCMHLPLSSYPEQVWSSFDPKVRNQIRKAEKSNIIAVSGGSELLDKFYGVYTIRMRQLGTPCYSRNIMESILRQMPDNARIFIVQLGELTVGGGFTTCFNGLAEIPWASTLVEYNSLCPNNLLYWSVIKHYCLAGAEKFDFGRCTIDGPTYKFKKQWDPEPVELHYQYWVHPAHKFTVLSPDNPKYKRKVEMWKRMPLWLTRILGPVISRNLP